MAFIRLVCVTFGVCLVMACTPKGRLDTSFVQRAAASERHMLGDTEVRIKVTRFGSGFTLLALHEDEQTSVRAAKTVLSATGGTLVEVLHGGGRNITFALHGIRHTIDPNRIFTDAGIKRALGATYSEEAHRAVRAFADAVQRHVSGRAVVALHNNTDGAYSLQSYAPGGRYARDASVVHAAPGTDTDDFFFTTSTALFNSIKRSGYNAVLQSGGATDDGSLSVYCARKRIPYVNVEAQHGHRAEQEDMLRVLLGR